MHVRMNKHRSEFVVEDLRYAKSALSLHCFLVHKDHFSMDIFKLGIVKRVRPLVMNREEDYFVSKFRTRIWGLNRYAIVR